MEIVSGGGEWGYASLGELEGIVVNVKCSIGGSIIAFPMRVELDEYWDVIPMSEVLAKRP